MEKELWCSGCNMYHPISEFGIDKQKVNRDGRNYYCKKAIRKRNFENQPYYRKYYQENKDDYIKRNKRNSPKQPVICIIRTIDKKWMWIGYTTSFQDYFRKHKASLPRDVELIVVISGDRRLEKLIHIELDDYRRGITKWFECCDSSIRALTRIVLGNV